MAITQRISAEAIQTRSKRERMLGENTESKGRGYTKQKATDEGRTSDNTIQTNKAKATQNKKPPGSGSATKHRGQASAI